MSRLPTALVLGQLVGLLGWIDPLFFPLVFVGPLVAGGVCAGLGLRASWPALLWASAGVSMLWTDWVVNREDVIFHAVLAVVMALLAAAGWGVVTLARRGRQKQTSATLG
ncbi:MAG: hypothetical protein ACRDWY_09335 [Actinomycetes bacterium]